ncbi:uncharacterized protein LOC133038111 [Cannabis sativa]|uniref:uncharacterized protein LOC133038111 n=1 Tax=Cannabis sativa TaxID=3483 RepID=UPI0029CA7EB0|nr:uncharacterized protein LOC133038111 [Cannabis sativa]
MGFDLRFIGLVIATVSSVRYKIIHGGHELGPIVPERGIRQGDPSSPYLFLIFAEGFSSLVRKLERDGRLKGCKVANGAPVISHMLFTDASYVYCRANDREASHILHLLQLFEIASGQQVNFSKSSVFLSTNVPNATRDRLCGILRMRLADEHSTYLGFPCVMGRNKDAILGFLKDKMQKRIQSWEGHFLSTAGREYWWSSSSRKGVSWFSWRKLCNNKSSGGMGFWSLREYNLSLLGKQGWRLLLHQDSLVGRIYKARYFPNCSFLEAELGGNPSFIWPSVLESQTLLRDGARRRIGPGSSTELMKPDSRQWDLELIEDLFDSCDVELIKQTVNVSWNSSMEDDVWKMMWKIKAPPKDNKGLVEEAVMVGWAFWKARNDMLWNGKCCSAADVVWLTRTTLRQWTCAQSKQLDTGSLASNRTDTREHWSKPAAGQLKINVDGAIFEDTNEIGTGFVARDFDGRLIEAFSTIFSVSCRPEIVEILCKDRLV